MDSGILLPNNSQCLHSSTSSKSLGWMLHSSRSCFRPSRFMRLLSSHSFGWSLTSFNQPLQSSSILASILWNTGSHRLLKSTLKDLSPSQVVLVSTSKEWRSLFDFSRVWNARPAQYGSNAGYAFFFFSAVSSHFMALTSLRNFFSVCEWKNLWFLLFSRFTFSHFYIFWVKLLIFKKFFLLTACKLNLIY